MVVVKDLYASIRTYFQGQVLDFSNLKLYLWGKALLKFLGRKYMATVISSVVLISLI